MMGFLVDGIFLGTKGLQASFLKTSLPITFSEYFPRRDTSSSMSFFPREQRADDDDDDDDKG